MKGTFVIRLVVLMVLVGTLVSACAQPTPVPAQPTAAPQPAAPRARGCGTDQGA